jgi:RNA polymerase sigma-70 factor (ECF subfamily)
MNDRVQAAHTHGSAANPGVVVAYESFRAALLRKVGDHEQAMSAQDVAEIYFACGCAGGDSVALARFDREYLGLVSAALAPMGLPAATVEDVKQEVRKKLLLGGTTARLCEYAGRGQLKSLVRVVAVRQALELIRGAKRERPTDDADLERAAPEADPELRNMKAQYRHALGDAVAEATKRLTPRQRTLLRLQVIDGLMVEELAALFRVHRATMSRWLQGARRELAATTRSLLMERHKISESELRSMARIIDNSLDASLNTLLREDADLP